MYKVLILCGGFGTRFNNGKPGPLKPLIKLDDEEILKKIIDIYSKFINCEFILLGGYRYKELTKFSKKYKNYKISVLDTGLETATAGRLLLAKKIIGNCNFFLTYGDSLANFNAKKSLMLKQKNNYVIGVSEFTIPYGVLKIGKKNLLKNFSEKKITININAGFYIFDNSIFDFIKSKNDSLENKILPMILRSKKEIYCNFLSKWQPIDELLDKIKVSNIIKKNKNYFMHD